MQSKNSAKKTNLVKYFTGKPCKRGHLTWRYTNTGACQGCLAFYAREFRAAKKVFDQIIVKYRVHKEDKDHLDRYVKSLNQARKLQNC